MVSLDLFTTVALAPWSPTWVAEVLVLLWRAFHLPIWSFWLIVSKLWELLIEVVLQTFITKMIRFAITFCKMVSKASRISVWGHRACIWRMFRSCSPQILKEKAKVATAGIILTSEAWKQVWAQIGIVPVYDAHAQWSRPINLGHLPKGGLIHIFLGLFQFSSWDLTTAWGCQPLSGGWRSPDITTDLL